MEPVTTGVAEADQPRLSKDGSKLVFRSRVASVNPTAVPFDPASERAGVPRQLLRRTGRLFPTSVSPDGRSLAPSGRTVGLAILDIATRAVKRVNEHATTPFIAWLPDSRRVLYPQEDKLWISDVDTGARREIALSFTPGDICIAAAPDGRTLFLCVADIQADLWLAQRK